MIENDFECYWHVLPKSVVKRYAMIAVQQNCMYIANSVFGALVDECKSSL